MFKKLLFSLLFCSSTFSFAQEIKHLSTDFRSVQPNGRRAMWDDDKEFTSYVGLNWNVGFGDIIFWDNRTYFYGDGAKVQEIGWEYKFGVNLTSKVNVHWFHHSEHWADIKPYPNKKFPVTDAIGINIKWFDKK